MTPQNFEITDRLKDNISCMGFYKVGDQRFKDKVAALMYATKVNIHPEWDFNNEVFKRYDWTVEPTESLDELYRARAQEIRDTYSYVAISYSGGADSHQVLMAFLNNNLRVDEVIVTWPVKRSERLGADATDLSPENYISEWELTIKPRLKWLSENYPEIVITVNDWTDGIEKVELPDDLLMYRGNMMALYAFLRHNKVSDVGRIHGRNGVIIYGLDKPRVCIHNGTYNLWFVDVVAQSCFSFIDDRQIANELFFWSPKSCKIIAKQAHLVANYAESNPHFKAILGWPPRPEDRNTYEITVKGLVYPNTNTTLFQTFKPWHSNVLNDMVIMGSELEARYMVAYERNWAQLQQVIEEKYFQKVAGQTQLIGFINGMWPIRPA